MSKPHHPHDSAAKDTLAWALGPFGHIEAQREVNAPTQYADIWFSPNPQAGPAPSPYLSLLRKMGNRPSIFEAFRSNPSSDYCADIFYKAEGLRRDLRRKHLNDQVYVWIISPGEPKEALARSWARPDNEFGKGFFEIPPMWDGHLVIPRFLPRTPETLILRLLGNGTTQRDAFAELRDLDVDEIREPLLEIFLRWRLIEIEVPEKQRDDAGKDFIMNTQIIYEATKAQWIAEGRQEGHLQGLKEGMSEGIDRGQLMSTRQNAVAFYEGRFEKNASPEVIKRLSTLTLAELQTLVPKLAKLSQEEIHAAIGLKTTPSNED